MSGTKPIFTNLKERFRHIELPAKLLDYFLRSNKSNINIERQAEKKSTVSYAILAIYPTTCVTESTIATLSMPTAPRLATAVMGKRREHSTRISTPGATSERFVLMLKFTVPFYTRRMCPVMSRILFWQGNTYSCRGLVLLCALLE